MVKDKAKEEIDKLRIEITTLQSSIDTLNREKNDADRQITRLHEEINTKDNKCKVNLSELESKISTLTRDLENRGDINIQLNTCTDDLNRVQASTQRYEQTISGLNMKIQNLENDKRGLQEQYNQCSNVQIGSLNSEVQRVVSMVEEYKRQLDNCQEHLNIIESFEGISSGRTYTGLSIQDKIRRILNDFLECYNNNQNVMITIESYNTMISNANNTIRECNNKVEELERLRENYEVRVRTYEVDLEDCKWKSQDTEGRYSQFEIQIRNIEESLQDCRQQLQSEKDRYQSLTIEITTTRQTMDDCQQNLRRVEADLEQYRRSEQGLKDLQDNLNIELSQCKARLEEEAGNFRMMIGRMEEDARGNMTMYMNAINDYNRLQDEYNRLVDTNNSLTIQIDTLRKDIVYYESMANEAKLKYGNIQQEMMALRESEQRRMEELMAKLTSAVEISRSKDIKVKEDWRIIDELLQLNQIIMTALGQLNKGALATIMKGENVILREAYDLDQEPVQRFSDIVTKFLDTYTVKPVTTASWDIFIGYINDLESAREFKIDIMHRRLNKRFGCSYNT
jgi:chromosome segregation ATPase